MRDRPVRICYAGTYERAYPRNRLIVAALRAAGARVEEAHVPVFERARDKSAPGVRQLAGLALRLGLAYVRLGPEVALRLLRCDALMIGYIGQLDALLLAPLARLAGRPVVFNPLVTLTDTLVEDRGLVREGGIPARLIAGIDRTALSLADLVLTDTAANARYLHARFGVPEQKLLVVPVGADERACAPDPAAEFACGPLDVLFVGKFIPLHGVETILRAAALLRDRDVDARVELVGTGQTYAQARALARDLALGGDRLTWTDWIEPDALGERLRRADIALGIFDAGEKAARVIPNKVYQSLASGVATITRSSPAILELLRDGESVVLVPPADPESLASAIAHLAHPRARRRVANGGYHTYLRHASAAALARQVAPVVALARARTRARAQVRGRA